MGGEIADPVLEQIARLRPHDCRRVFASEHLNNNTPIHVIQALLGHASSEP